MNKSTSIPGPINIPFIGYKLKGLHMLINPIDFFLSMNKKFGNICSWAKNDSKFTNVYGAEFNQHVLTNELNFEIDSFREHNLPTGTSFERLSLSLMKLNGEEHKRHRKLIIPAFTKDKLDSYLLPIVDETQSLISQWKVDTVINFSEQMMNLITNISMRTMFGINPIQGKPLLTSINSLIKLAGSPFTTILPYNLPGLPFNKMLNVSQDIEAFILEVIKNDSSNENQIPNTISMLLNAKDSFGLKLTTEEIVGHAYTVLCQESIASTLTWFFICLDRSPKILNQIISEIQSQIGTALPTIKQIQQLQTLDLALKESLRLFPASPFGLRYCKNDCQLDSY